jgi:putative beta-barrel porin BBP2
VVDRIGRRGRWIAFLMLSLCASPVLAQTPPELVPDPDTEATIRFGPLSLKSTLALANIGVDTNVFNAAENPQSDFTMTFTPTTNLWLRMGRTWISGRINVDWVYYQTFASERSANADYRLGITRAFNRVLLTGMARHLNTRERPGFEIDARSDRSETEWDGSGEIRVMSQTYIGARVWRRRVAFDKDEMFRGSNLADELNRTVEGRALIVRHVLTPLTTVSLQAGRERERFTLTSLRDADSTRISGTATFQPLALISGNATMGYRHFTPLSADVPTYRGATTALSLSYTLLATTRFGIEASRDVQPSLEFAHPYYLETGIGGLVQHQVFGPFDVLARIGTRELAYRDRLGMAPEVSNRVDRVRAFGIGGGYRLGTDKRIGFTIERQNRTSNVDAHGYRGLRFGMSLTYET